MNYFLLLLIALILIITIFVIFGKKLKVAGKSAYVKKNEIIINYKFQMKELILTHKNNQERLKEEKIKFIKNANQELSKNIFFTQEEIRKIIYELTML
ncbi:MAG: hypothetical protein WC141_03145 [Arcobacteraceae bacterium]